MSKSSPSLRSELDPYDHLPSLVITTRSGVQDPGLTMCRIRDEHGERVLGMISIRREGEWFEDRSLWVENIETGFQINRRWVYFAAWYEMLRLAYHEKRSLVSSPTAVSDEEVAAWQWLEEGGVAEITEPFSPIPILGKCSVYYAGAAIAYPPQGNSITLID